MGSCCSRICDKGQDYNSFTKFNKVSLLGALCQECGREVRNIMDVFIMEEKYMVGHNKNSDLSCVVICSEKCHKKYLMRYHSYECQRRVQHGITATHTIDDL